MNKWFNFLDFEFKLKIYNTIFIITICIFVDILYMNYIYISNNRGHQSRRQIHSHQLVNKQLKSIGHFYVVYFTTIITDSALKYVLSQICYRYQTTFLTDVHLVCVTHIKESLFQHSCCAMSYHTVTFHLSKSKPAIS